MDNSIARETGIPDEHSAGSISPMMSKFSKELEDAVRKHQHYLYEVVRMPEVKLPEWYAIVKRSMDIFVGLTGLIILSPLLLIVSILIKIDSHGPVIFSQIRVGKNGKLFKIYKFRIMIHNAEQKTGPVLPLEDDPRLTFIGKYLRKSCMDEFPQFLNLIKGDITLVGPRPERLFFVNYFTNAIPGYSRRLDVTPGITGVAQLRSGYDGNAMDVIRKLRFDITYMKKMNLAFDLGLLAETFVNFLMGKL